MSLDTTDRRKAPGIAHEKVAQSQQGKLSQASRSFARLAFGEAADRYIAGRGIELAESSLKKEKQLLVKPREFFRATALNRISAERILEHREWRAAQGVGPAMLNMEVGVCQKNIEAGKALAHNSG